MPESLVDPRDALEDGRKSQRLSHMTPAKWGSLPEESSGSARTTSGFSVTAYEQNEANTSNGALFVGLSRALLISAVPRRPLCSRNLTPVVEVKGSARERRRWSPSIS